MYLLCKDSTICSSSMYSSSCQKPFCMQSNSNKWLRGSSKGGGRDCNIALVPQMSCLETVQSQTSWIPAKLHSGDRGQSPRCASFSSRCLIEKCPFFSGSCTSGGDQSTFLSLWYSALQLPRFIAVRFCFGLFPEIFPSGKPRVESFSFLFSFLLKHKQLRHMEDLEVKSTGETL